jgi:hypothetical protein
MADQALELAREYRDKLTEALDLMKKKDEDFIAALRWIAQTVHQAHHGDVNYTWESCNKIVCYYIRQLLQPLEKI